MATVTQNIKKLVRNSFFKSNLWEISSPEFPDLQLFAQSVNIPFRSFEVVEDKTVEKDYYSSYTNPKNITLSIIETEDLKVSNYIQDWVDSYFDSNTATYKVGVDPRRTFVISLQKFKKDVVAKALNAAGSVGSLVAALSGIGVPTVNYPKLGIGTGLTSSAVNESVSQIQSSNLVDPFDIIDVFEATNCRFLSRSEFSLSYQEGEITIVEVNLSAERIVRWSQGPTISQNPF